MQRTAGRFTAIALVVVMLVSVVSMSVAAQQVDPTSGTGILDNPEDSDIDREALIQLDGDPAAEGRENVVHLTSRGTSTQDYALTTVDVTDTQLSDVTDLSFEFFEGADNAGAAPDEVWLVLEDDNGNRRIVFRTFADGFASGQWQTQDVDPAITGDTPGSGGAPVGVWTEVTEAEGISNPRAALDDLSSDDLSTLSEDLTAASGISGSSTLLAVGVGHGSPETGSTTVDLFLDDLTLNGDTFEFPGVDPDFDPDALNLDAAPDARVTVFIELTGDWAGTVDDIDPSTVQLNGVPAIQQTAGVDDFDNDGVDELQVQFNRGNVAATLEPGEDVAVVVDGIFTDDQTGFAGADRIRAFRAPRAGAPIGPFENAPSDPDGDGVFEDTNGDGRFSIADVQAIFQNRRDSTVGDNQALFDYNGDGRFSIADVQFLFANREQFGT